MANAPATPEELALPIEQVFMDAFKSADTNQDGTLDRQEFATLLREMDLGLSERQIRRMLSEADGNRDGLIDYNEFVPMIKDILTADVAAELTALEASSLQLAATDDAESMLLYGVPKEELETAMRGMFESADTNKSGKLDIKEFKACLQSLNLGLGRKDINLLMATVDVDHDHLVSYEEFMPLCFKVLVDRFADAAMTSAALLTDDALSQELLRRFRAADSLNARELPLRAIRKVLESVSEEVLPMSTYQIHPMFAMAPPGRAHGQLDYVRFAPRAASSMLKVVGAANMRRLHAALQALGDGDPVAAGDAALKAARLAALDELVSEAFVRAGVEATAKLSGDKFATVFNELLATCGHESLRLGPGEWAVLAAAADANGDQEVTKDEMVAFMYDLIVHVERDRLLQERMPQEGGAASDAPGGGSAPGEPATGGAPGTAADVQPAPGASDVGKPSGGDVTGAQAGEEAAAGAGEKAGTGKAVVDAAGAGNVGASEHVVSTQEVVSAGQVKAGDKAKVAASAPAGSAAEPAK